MHRFDIIVRLIKKRLKKNRGAEIGVWKGETSRALCRKFNKLRLYAVDPYRYYDHYAEHHNLGKYDNQKALDDLYRQARKSMPNRVTMIRAASTVAASSIEDESLDFVFLDGNYGYEYVKKDIETWLPKVRKGGVIIGQNIDSNKDGPESVKRAVEETIGKDYKVMGRRWYYEA